MNAERKVPVDLSEEHAVEDANVGLLEAAVIVGAAAILMGFSFVGGWVMRRIGSRS